MLKERINLNRKKCHFKQVKEVIWDVMILMKIVYRFHLFYVFNILYDKAPPRVHSLNIWRPTSMLLDYATEWHGACVKIMTVTWHGCIVDLEFISSSNCTYTFTYKTSLYGCTRSVMQACSVQWYRWFCKANTCSSGDQSIGSISSFVPKTVHIRKCCENSLNQWKLVRLMLSFYELRREVSVVCGGVCVCVCSWSGLQVCFCRLANTYNYIFPAADVKP